MASESAKASASGGVGSLGLLGVAFVVLKLCGVIDWSWWWVTCPFWGGFALLLGLALLVLLCGGVLWGIASVAAVIETRRSK